MTNVHYPKVAPVGYYVYVFVIDGISRYIGKGQRNRYCEHVRVVRRKTEGSSLAEWGNPRPLTAAPDSGPNIGR